MEFLKYITTDLYNKYGDRLQDITIVLPTRRASLFIRNYLAELMDNTPICAPECITISDLFESLCHLQQADEIKATCLLYDIYRRKLNGAMGNEKMLTLDCFYGWGRQLIADFNNVDKNYRDSSGENIFRSSAEARNFDKEMIDSDVEERILRLIKGNNAPTKAEQDSFRQNFEIIWDALPDIYKELTETLEKDNCALEGACNKWVISHFDEIWPTIKERTFVFAGFNILLGTEKKLMHLLKDKGHALFYWDYDQAFAEAEPHISAYRHTKANFEEFGGEIENADNGEKKINLIAAPSDNAQARFVHNWLMQNHKSGDKTAVVLCNEQILQPVIFSIPETYSDNVNITKGFPLKHTHIFAQVSNWLNNPANIKASYTETLQELLQYIDNANENSSENTDNTTGNSWAQLLATESQYQARCVVVRFMQLLEDGTLAAVEQFHTLRNLLQQHLGQVSIPFHGEPITDIQIIGVLETRTLDFDNLLLLNVEEGVVPHTSHDNSFIPYYLRKYYGLTTNDEQTDVYAYNFFRILRRARNITMLYSEAQTAEGQKSMSRFVMQILTSSTMRSNINRYIIDENIHISENDSDDEETLHQHILNQRPYPNLLEKFKAQKREKPEEELKLSPSAINTYLSCKMKFFFKYMLSLREPDSEDSLLQVNELGTLIHESLRAAYTIISPSEGTGRILPAQINSFLNNPSQIDTTINMAYEALNKDRVAKPYLREEHEIETQVAKKHLIKVLTNDAKAENLEILGNERKAYHRYKHPELGDILIGGSIDRLDIVTESGKRAMRIVDYKTGGYHVEKMEAENMEVLFKPASEQGYVLQTMIYSLACLNEEDIKPRATQMPVKPILLFTQKDLNDFDPHLKLAGIAITDIKDHKTSFEQMLHDNVDMILNETSFEKAVVNEGKPCKYCAFAQLCNRQKLKDSTW